MYSNEKAREILTLALEIEGLALLIQRRGDLVNPEVNNILRDKASRLLEMTEEMAGQPEPSATCVMPAGKAPVCQPEVAAVPVVEAVVEPVVEAPAESVCLSPESSAVSDECAVAAAAIEEEVADSYEDPAVEKADEHPHKAAAAMEGTSQRAAQPVFTLNDRFRFIRELFKGNSQDFNDTLSLVATMTSADEITEYLTEDLCLDPENQDVADFIAIVTQRFN